MKNNGVLRIICYIIFVAAFVGVFFVMSIMDLVNVNDVHEGRVHAAGELLIVENSINGLIPTGKDYYYLALDHETGTVYTIHAEKSWLAKNFDAEGYAPADGIKIKGLAKRAGDFEVEQELAVRVRQFVAGVGDSAVNLAFTPGQVLELHYVRDALMRMIAGTVLLITGVISAIFTKRKEELPAWAGKPLILLFIVALFFGLWTIL